MGFKSKLKSAIRALVLLTKEEVVKPIIVAKDKECLLDGKIALITGGSSGIGLAIAKAFAESGAKVIIAGTNKNKLIDAERKISVGGVLQNILN